MSVYIQKEKKVEKEFDGPQGNIFEGDTGPGTFRPCLRKGRSTSEKAVRMQILSSNRGKIVENYRKSWKKTSGTSHKRLESCPRRNMTPACFWDSALFTPFLMGYMMIHGFLAESASPTTPTTTMTPRAILSILGAGNNGGINIETFPPCSDFEVVG